MNAIFLLAIIAGLSGQKISRKIYNGKIKNGVFTFSALSSICAMLFFVPSLSDGFYYSSKAFYYSVGFAVSNSVALVVTFLAIKKGPLSLSSLGISYSLIIPALYGLIFLDEPVTSLLITGIVLLLISIFLMNVEKKGEEKKITFEWIIYVLLAFLSNGICSTVQKVQPIACDNMYKNEFMFVALFMSAVFLFVFSLIYEKNTFILNAKKGFSCYLICGVGKGIVNMFIISLSTMMAASVMFPLIAAGDVILTVGVSILIYKEKLSIQQIFGIILGILSIVLINI